MRHSAKRFFAKALAAPHTSIPRVITVDKNAAYPKAFKELKAEGIMSEASKYLNTLVEQDHRLLDGCLEALTSRFARWTKPLRTSLPLSCVGYLVYLFEDDGRKGRTEGPFLLSLGGRGGSSKALLKSVCEKAETREPAQAGDV